MKNLFCFAWIVMSTLALPLLAQPLPSSSPAAEGFDPERLGYMHRLVQDQVITGKYPGAVTLVARHGRVVDFKTYGYRNLEAKLAMEPNTIMRIYSATKVITSVAALQLFEQGHFQLSDPITNWIPELTNLMVCTGGTVDNPTLEAARTNITMKMLMTHTAGFSQEDPFIAPMPIRKIYERARLMESASLDEFAQKVSKLPLAAQPGKEFIYGVSYELLGLIVERISGEKFDLYCAKHIFTPLKMYDTGFDVPPEKMSRLAKLYETGPDGKLREAKVAFGAYAEAGRGIPGGGSGAFSTVGDYARFLQMLLNGGQLEGVRILGRMTVELGMANALSHMPRITHSFSDSEGYGLLGGVRVDIGKGETPGSIGEFEWGGYAKTEFMINPREQVLMLFFTQHVPYFNNLITYKFYTTVYQALLD
jgi:CubicO group peptidase (beta-lactamase class C family)